ncbi:MAG: type IV-A pilus assembly ATPase PilB [Deltaproteobacteria bacterium]|nr:MAG: type IV-A pilus assembly ATPase PilB [Deltaproteobacteria bacterium]
MSDNKSGSSRSSFRRSGAGALLVRDDKALSSEVKKAQESQKKEGGRLGKHLAKQGLIDESELASFLSNQYKVPAVSLSDFEIEEDVLALIPVDVVQKHQAIPLSRVGNTLIVAMVDPSNIYAIDDLKFITGYNIDVVVTTEGSFAGAVEQYYGQEVQQDEEGSSAIPSIDYDEIMNEIDEDEVDVVQDEADGATVLDLERAAEDAPVIRLVNLILLDAIRKGASDIHIEPYEKSMRVRYRIDGVLYEVMKPPFKLKNSITSRLKVMSKLDIAERRLPQDGRIKLRIGRDKEMDFRVSVLPCLFGEKTVLRLLDKSNLQLDMTKLGFFEKQLQDFKESIGRPFGMVLVTGPTGSGKTTSLYSALADLNKPGVNISTAEDPVEFNLEGINQVQQHDDIGLNFAATLRSFLRQDPDIIMVGEIRDFETGEIAVKAALTGHLVLSTLHTNDAPSTVNRLLNMGIEPFLVTAATNMILAQRLGRRICKGCKEVADVPDQTLLKMGVPEDEIGTFDVMVGGGCEICNGTGYKGRIAFYEAMPMYDELKDMVLTGASNSELKATAIRLGMSTLRMSALTRLKEGLTTVAEVVRNTAPDEF